MTGAASTGSAGSRIDKADRAFRLRGSGGAGVMLVHGLTGSPGEMKFLARRLNRLGFDVYAPQLAGHGGTQRDLLQTTWRDWLDSLRDAYAVYRREVDEVHVAGICVGGALGLLLAAEHPEIRTCAVYSMTFEYDGWNMSGWGRAARWLQFAADLPFLRNLSFEEPAPYGIKDWRLRERIQQSQDMCMQGALDRMPLGALFQMYRLGRHVLRVGRHIHTPTLIIHARHDDMSHPRNAQRLRDCLGGAATVRYLTDCYHMIHVDQERDKVADLSAGFFTAHGDLAPSAAVANG